MCLKHDLCEMVKVHPPGCAAGRRETRVLRQARSSWERDFVALCRVAYGDFWDFVAL